MYTKPECFNTKKVYSWCEYHHKKIDASRFVDSYHGTAPFLWELAKTYVEHDYVVSGSLFMLPRDDQVTIRDSDWEQVQDALSWAPRPITFLIPFRSCDVWKDWKKLRFPEYSKFHTLDNRETRQFELSELMLKHEHIFIPWPGTDVYYAEFLGRKVHVYDDIKNYRTKTADECERDTSGPVLRFLKWGYDYLNEVQKEYFHWTEHWHLLDAKDRKFLTSRMLGLSQLKSPEELYNDLVLNEYLPDNKFVNTGEYDAAYEWLKEKKEKLDNIVCSDKCITLYNKL